MQKTPWILIALLAAVCVSLAAPAAASAQGCTLRDPRAPWSSSAFSGTCRSITREAGSRGGTAFTLACSGNEVLIGVRGKADSYLHSVTALCVPVDPRTGTWSGSVQARGSRGGSGGQTFDLRCNRNEAVAGLSGRAGIYVDNLRVRCRALGANTVATGSQRIVPGSAGGSGGTSFSGTAYYCGSNMPATRLTGRAGIWIDAISLGCSWMFPGTFALASPTDNTRLTTTTPTFTWGASSGATSATIDLTQVGSSSTGRSFSVPPATTSYRWPAGQWPFASGASILWRIRACNANACREVVRHLIAP